MGHSLNYGLTTNAKGASWDQFRVSIGATGAPTLTEDCGAGLINSTITRVSAGLYTFQMTAPYPAKMVTLTPTLGGLSATDPVLTARYVVGSYNATTGQFQVQISSQPTSTTAAAADAPSGSELHVEMVTRRYSANP